MENEPICGPNYEAGLWSRRNIEAYLEDQKAAQQAQPAQEPITDTLICYSCGKPVGEHGLTEDSRGTKWRGVCPADAQPAQPVQQSRDWKEDAAHENGNYLCQCHSCGNQFTGHKRRVTCKVCVDAQQAQPALQFPEKPSDELSLQLLRSMEIAKAINRGGVPPIDFDAQPSLMQRIQAVPPFNMNGYDEDDVRQMHDWAVSVVHLAEQAQPADAKPLTNHERIELYELRHAVSAQQAQPAPQAEMIRALMIEAQQIPATLSTVDAIPLTPLQVAWIAGKVRSIDTQQAQPAAELVPSGYAVVNESGDVLATYPPGGANQRKAHWFVRAIKEGTPNNPQVTELFRKVTK